MTKRNLVVEYVIKRKMAVEIPHDGTDPYYIAQAMAQLVQNSGLTGVQSGLDPETITFYFEEAEDAVS